MSPQHKRWFTIFSFFLFSLFLFNGLSHAQVTITTNYAEIDQLTVGDLDFESFGSQHWFFTVNIDAPPATQVKLFLRVDVSLAEDYFQNAVSLTTLPFSAPRSFTNLDLGKNGTIQIEPGSFQFSSEAKDKIKNIALATGKLPTGTYTFYLRAENAVNPVLGADSTQIVLTLRPPSRIELISPMNNNTVTSAFPMFQWQYDGDQVELSVYEKLPQHTSNEEALTGTPYLTVRTGDPGLPAGVRTYQYPASAARALEAGKSYVWAVKSITSGTGGSDAGLNSEIWLFTVPSSTGGSGSNDPVEQIVETQELADQLQELPGMDVSALQELLRQYQMTGDIYLNGQKISLLELQQILNDLLSNPDRIVEMKVINQ